MSPCAHIRKRRCLMIRWSRFLLVRLLAKHNPFYLMSAACMLAGILALTNSLSWRPIPISRLLLLIVTLNIYEAALIGLALFLIIRRKLLRDGKILLILEAFFLVDTSFLNAEIVTAHYALGVAINVLLYLLAVGKLTLVLKVLKPEFSFGKYGFLLLELAVLFGLPCVLRRIDHGSL